MITNKQYMKNKNTKIESVVKLTKKIKGFMSVEEGMHLYNLTLHASKLGPCLEIGSYCGKSAVYIGSACKQTSSILFSIDHHKGSEEQQKGEMYFDPDLFDSNLSMVNTLNLFRENVLKTDLEDNVIAIVGKSDIIAKNWGPQLGMIFIDGSHTYENVLIDYLSWHKYLLPKGYMIFHDIFKDLTQGGQGPHKVYKMAIRSGLFIEHEMVGTLGILEVKR